MKLGRPASLNARSHAVRDLKGKGFGIRATPRELGMPLSSIHKILDA